MFPYPCPYCSQRLLAPPERVGQRTICPKCLRPVVIPTAEKAAADSPDVDHSLPHPSADANIDDHTPVPGASRPRRATAATATTARAVGTGSNGSGRLLATHTPPPSGRIGMDFAAELSAAVSMRMKPPPEPATDLQVSTGLWLALSVLALALWAGAVFYDPALLPFVAVIGVLQAAFGYLWAAYLAGRRNWVQGALTLLPPFAAVRLAKPFGENAYRPLRFLLTGLFFVVLWTLGPAARSAAAPLVAAIDGPRAEPADVLNPAAGIKAELDSRTQGRLVARLAELTADDATRAHLKANEPARAEVVALLKTLATDDRTDVRAAAVKGLAEWAPADAAGPVLDGVRSANPALRRACLRLAGRFPTADMAAAVAARFLDKSDRSLAEDALLEIGRPAEDALIPLLASDDGLLVVHVCELLERVGGPRSAAALEQLAKASPGGFVRAAAEQKAKAVLARLK